MTFEEWKQTNPKAWGFDRDMTHLLTTCWDAAKEGTVEIPSESEWPASAESLEVHAYDNNGGFIKVLAHLGRSKPKWTPSVGDPVFALFLGGVVIGGVVNTNPFLGKGFHGGRWYGVKHSNGEIVTYGINSLKTFNPIHIGKKWEDIPNES